MTAPPSTPLHAPETPPSRSGRFWLPVIALAALAVLLIAGYVAVNRTSQDTADPATTGTPAAPGGASAAGAATISAAPSTSASASASASAGAKPSAKAGSKAAKQPEESAHTIAGWPGPGNTGVPAGTKLSTYGGPCTVQKAGTVIDAKTLNCDLTILAADVTVKRSKINGIVFLDTDRSGSSGWSLTLVDSEVNAGVQERAAVSDGNITVLRSNIHGGVTSVHCGDHATKCVVQDSYLHDQGLPATASWHLGGVQSNGGHNIRLSHNYIVCSPPVNSVGEGCTGDVVLLGDFAQIRDVVVEDNFLGANNSGISYCLYGGSAQSKPYPTASNVVVRNNLFERGKNGKCGAYGPVSSFNGSGSGNVWTNNTWQGGGAIKGEM